MINSLVKSALLKESTGKTMFITFGRFNPPTRGHEKLLNLVRNMAYAADGSFLIFPSKSTDASKLPLGGDVEAKLSKVKNPLDPAFKISLMKQAFPDLAKEIVNTIDKGIVNILHALAYVYNIKTSGRSDYSSVVIVVGEDRASEFENLANKYNGIESSHGFYNFEEIKVEKVSRSIEDGGDDISASKARAMALANDLTGFLEAMPSTLPKDKAEGLFNKLRIIYQVSDE